MKIKEMIKGYEGQYVILTEGEKFYGKAPWVVEGSEYIYKAELRVSHGYNNGAYIINSGEGYGVLTCSKELAETLVKQLPEEARGGAMVPMYNGSVWYDDAQRRIVKMAAACGK